MNDWFKGLQRFIFESFGSIKDITEDYIIGYIEFLKRTFTPSLWVIGAVVILMILSEISGYAIFNILGTLIAGLFMLCWVVILQPAIVLGEQLDRFPVISRIFSRITNAFLVFFVVFIFSFNVSSGFEGGSQLALFLMMVFGFMLLGTSFLRQQLGLKLILLSSLFAIIGYFPLTSTNFHFFRKLLDIEFSSKLIPIAEEYKFKIETFGTTNGLERPRFFVNNQPMLWCREYNDYISGYKCFKQPGRDPITNDELIPISNEIIKKIKLRLTQANAQAEAQLAAEQSAAVQKAKQERIKQIEEEKSAYLRKYLIGRSNKVDVATSFSNGSKLDMELSNQLRIGYKKPVKAGFLTQQALKDGVFDRLFQSDKSEFEKLELVGFANKIMLGEIKQTTSGNKAIAGVIDATILVDVRLLNTLTGEIINSSQINGSSAGYSESEAISKARSKAVKAIIEQFEL